MTAETVSDPHPCEEEVDDLIGAVLRDGREIEAGCQESGTCSGDVLDARYRLEKAINRMADRAARHIDWPEVARRLTEPAPLDAAMDIYLCTRTGKMDDSMRAALLEAVRVAAARGKEAP